jgi:hypothetical protein
VKTRFIFLTILLTACSASQPPDTCNATPVCSEVRPDTAKSKLHFREHVSYPANRTQILATCAKTKEFSDAERKWFIGLRGGNPAPSGRGGSPAALFVDVSPDGLEWCSSAGYRAVTR